MTQQQQQRPSLPHEPSPCDPVATDPAAAGAAAARVRVIAGADVQDLDLAGRCVGAARAIAAALFGIHPAAVALVGGRQVRDDHVLAVGEHLEFVKYAGEKGAGAQASVPAARSAIEIAESSAVWRRDGRTMGSTPVRHLLDRVVATGSGPATWRIHPPNVRLMAERAGGTVVGVVVEMPPGPRMVKWIADDSPDAFGTDARYCQRRLSFPWVVLFLVFRDGMLTGMQQAFFRSAPIESLDDHLSFTCLLNCAQAPAYENQESWVCLVALNNRSLRRLSWAARMKAITDHFWHAAFNRSAEMHEGNSYWESAGSIDARLASADAWEEATRTDPYFALQVRWRRASRTVGATLEYMLDRVAPWQPVERLEQLVTLMQLEP